MTRKRNYLVSAAILTACVCTALGVLVMLPPRPGVTKANFDRVEEGMSRRNVYDIFGKGPSWAYKGLYSGLALEKTEIMADKEGWIGDDGSQACVIFEDDKVFEKISWDPADESILDRFRRWLHLPK